MSRLHHNSSPVLPKSVPVVLSYVQLFFGLMDCNLPHSSVHGVSQEWVAIFPLGDLPNPGTEPRSPALQVDSLPSEAPRKPKYTGVGSLSLLQQNFQTQEINHGLLPCRQILYQPSYQQLRLPGQSILVLCSQDPGIS